MPLLHFVVQWRRVMPNSLKLLQLFFWFVRLPPFVPRWLQRCHIAEPPINDAPISIYAEIYINTYNCVFLPKGEMPLIIEKCIYMGFKHPTTLDSVNACTYDLFLLYNAYIWVLSTQTTPDSVNACIYGFQSPDTSR